MSAGNYHYGLGCWRQPYAGTVVDLVAAAVADAWSQVLVTPPGVAAASLLTAGAYAGIPNILYLWKVVWPYYWYRSGAVERTHH